MGKCCCFGGTCSTFQRHIPRGNGSLIVDLFSLFLAQLSYTKWPSKPGTTLFRSCVIQFSRLGEGSRVSEKEGHSNLAPRSTRAHSGIHNPYRVTDTGLLGRSIHSASLLYPGRPLLPFYSTAKPSQREHFISPALSAPARLREFRTIVSRGGERESCARCAAACGSTAACLPRPRPASSSRQAGN